tara:strand:- start:492 stop:770 length:279 start_codon:yes stop_codon:yes gene_type:complete
MEIEFSEKKLDLKERRRLHEILGKSLFARKFKRLHLRLKKYEKQGKRSKYTLTAEAETPEGKVIHAKGTNWRFGLALKAVTSKLTKQIRRKR